MGTVFKVYFPMVEGTVSSPRADLPARERPSLFGTETILLVEDDERVRALARTILLKFGYVVLEAQNAEDAFLLCEQFSGEIDLLLTDVVMPPMSGRQLADRLLLVRPEMKMLYMSGYTSDAVVHTGVLEATIAFIQKPLTPEPLNRKIRSVLSANYVPNASGVMAVAMPASVGLTPVLPSLTRSLGCSACRPWAWTQRSQSGRSGETRRSHSAAALAAYLIGRVRRACFGGVNEIGSIELLNNRFDAWRESPRKRHAQRTFGDDARWRNPPPHATGCTRDRARPKCDLL